MLLVSFVCWGLFPFFWMYSNAKKFVKNKNFVDEVDLNYIFKYVAILISFIYIFLFFYENLELTGSLFPILQSTSLEAHAAHVESLPFIGLITRGSSMVIVLLCLSLVNFKKNWLIYILIVLIFFLILAGYGLLLFLLYCLLSFCYIILNPLFLKNLRTLLL